MLMSSGFTDDLFPVDETIRYYNRTKGTYPESDLALFFGDFGHPRSANGKDDRGRRPAGPRGGLVRPLHQGRGRRARAGRDVLHPDLSQRRPLGRPLLGGELGGLRPGRDPLPRRGRADDRRRLDHRRAVQPGRQQRLHDRSGGRHRRRRRLPARRGPRRRLHAARCRHRDRSLRGRKRHVADRGAAARRRPRRDPDARQPRPLAPRAGRRQAGLPAPPERLDVRRGPRAEARAARRRRRRPSRSPATAGPPTGRRRSRSRT